MKIKTHLTSGSLVWTIPTAIQKDQKDSAKREAKREAKTENKTEANSDASDDGANQNPFKERRTPG
jgi:hypothetical protein